MRSETRVPPDAALEDAGPASASWRERRLAGRAMRAAVPRSAHADGGVEDGRDPIGILQAQAAARQPDLIGIRHSRMAASPFAYLRGAAAVRAPDLITAPGTGSRGQLCGDAHNRDLGNIATPERHPTVSLNDFDE